MVRSHVDVFCLPSMSKPVLVANKASINSMVLVGCVLLKSQLEVNRASAMFECAVHTDDAPLILVYRTRELNCLLQRKHYEQINFELG